MRTCSETALHRHPEPQADTHPRSPQHGQEVEPKTTKDRGLAAKVSSLKQLKKDRSINPLKRSQLRWYTAPRWEVSIWEISQLLDLLLLRTDQ